jgi:abscisic-aldehyde oxidase
MAVARSESSWHRPWSVEEYYKLIASDGSGTKAVAGNTSSGVYREPELYDRYIDLRRIRELNSISMDTEAVQIGAATTISRVIEILRRESDDCKDVVFGKIADHMEMVASHYVRNTASLGGNLVMAQRVEFPSDIATILLAAGSSVCIQVSSEKLNVTLEEFLEMPPCDNKTLLLSIFVPHCTPDSVSSSAGIVNMAGDKIERSLLFETYQTAPRPLGNAVAYLNSAFFAQVSSDVSSGSLVLENLRLAFGAYGTQHAIRARDVEKSLVGKPVSASLLLEASEVLKKTIVPKESTTHSAYRSSLAVAFLFSFLYPATKGNVKPVRSVRLNGHVASYTNGNRNCPRSVNIYVSPKETKCVKSGLYSNDHIL